MLRWPQCHQPASAITTDSTALANPAPAASHAWAPRIALVAGEASGDLLGAGLIRELKQRFPGAVFAGIGGPAMTGAGQEAWYPAERLSVMGLVEVLTQLPDLLALRRQLMARLRAFKPDVFIGIDAPDFNLAVEKKLKRRGIKTVHYVSPSVWAWRARRAAKIGASADRVLCLFPMEPPIYRQHGVSAKFVGHPLAERFALEPDRAKARRLLDIPDEVRVLALLPGSRASEIARLAEPFALASQQVMHAVPGLRVIAPMASPACRLEFDRILTRLNLRGRIEVIDGHAHEAMIAADVVLLASGTAALEAMLAKRPMVVGYRINPITYWIVKTFGLMRVSHYSLPNVLAGMPLVPERMQEDCKPTELAAAVLGYLRRPSTGDALMGKFREIHQSLRRNADREAANVVAELIQPGVVTK